MVWISLFPLLRTKWIFMVLPVATRTYSIYKENVRTKKRDDLVPEFQRPMKANPASIRVHVNRNIATV